MKKRKLFARLFVLLGVINLLLFSSCNSCNRAPKTPQDTKWIGEYHQLSCSDNETPLEKNNLSLYVDYSTCITLGQHSDFFQALESPLVKATKHYYSIKGPVIKEETNIDIYRELRNIVEVNYADLERAANLMAAGNSESMMLTDGEYYQKDIANGGINDPYMADALVTWLKKGHDIYILSEPYVEKHKGNDYNKKRFYFIFTDDRLEGNIYKRILHTIDWNKFPEVETFHLSAKHPKITIEGKTLKANEVLSASVKSCGNYEIHDWQIGWDAIENVILGGRDANTGELLPNGDYVISGLNVDKDNSFGGFRITDLDINVYDINYDYINFYNEKEYPTGTFAASELTPQPNVFTYDEKEFERTGTINLHLDKNMWTPSNILTGNPYNYTRVDICVTECQNIINDYASKFNFDAIGTQGKLNVSVTESIKQCLFDPDIQKKMYSEPLYTIYIKSNKY